MVTLTEQKLTIKRVDSFLESYPYHHMTFRPYIPFLSHLASEKKESYIALSADLGDKPVGFLFAISYINHTELLSVYTEPDHRGIGIAKALIRKFEATLKENGIKNIQLSIERGLPKRDVFEKILMDLNYDKPKLKALMCRIHGPEKISKAPWLRKREFPEGFELFLWKDLTQEERESIQRRQKESPWFPKNLNPFTLEYGIEYLNSLGMRYNGEVVGWVINHRPLPKLIRYTYMFIREDLQKFGLSAFMLMESIRLHVFSENMWDYPNATFKVPVEFEGMIKMVRSKMEKYLNQVNEIVKITKEL